MRRLTHDQRRTELIEAAIRVIARDGLAAASTRAIVTEADMPLGALHYIFSSRDALIRGVIEFVTDEERVAAMLGADIASGGEGTDLEKLIIAAIDAYLATLEAKPNHELALLEMAAHAMRHDRDAVTAQWATYRESAAQGLAYVAEKAGVRWVQPTDDLARYLVTWLDGLTVSWLADRDTAGARRTAALFATSFAALAAAPI